MRFGLQALTDVAVDEWRGSSPIYNARNRKNLKIEGDGVSAVFKAFQVDIGAPHHFLDFRFELVDEALGYFWPEYCGPYDGVNIMTEGHPDSLKTLCHDMEDTTFPSTTMAATIVPDKSSCTRDEDFVISNRHIKRPIASRLWYCHTCR